MQKIKIKKLHPNAVIPKRITLGAACSDVVATEVEINNNLALVKLGFSTEIPEGYKMCVSPRSSFTQKGWVMQNSPGQIDSDYRGEWMIKFEAFPACADYSREEGLIYPEFPYKAGDRVAQIWLEKIEDFEFEEVEELVESERADGSFGSTGNN